MAKRKKKKKMNFVLIASVAVIVALVVIFVALLCVAPNPDKLGKKYDSKGYEVVVVERGDSTVTDLALDIFGGEARVYSASDEDALSVKYYAELDEAKKVEDDFKKNDDEDDNVICIRRGKAVFIGTKEAGKIFRAQLG